MSQSMTAADANRSFSKLLRQGDATRLMARTTLLTRLAAARPRSIGTWTRDELYDDRIGRAR